MGCSCVGSNCLVICRWMVAKGRGCDQARGRGAARSEIIPATFQRIHMVRKIQKHVHGLVQVVIKGSLCTLLILLFYSFFKIHIFRLRWSSEWG